MVSDQYIQHLVEHITDLDAFYYSPSYKAYIRNTLIQYAGYDRLAAVNIEYFSGYGGCMTQINSVSSTNFSK